MKWVTEPRVTPGSWLNSPQAILDENAISCYHYRKVNGIRGMSMFCRTKLLTLPVLVFLALLYEAQGVDLTGAGNVTGQTMLSTSDEEVLNSPEAAYG